MMALAPMEGARTMNEKRITERQYVVERLSRDVMGGRAQAVLESLTAYREQLGIRRGRAMQASRHARQENRLIAAANWNGVADALASVLDELDDYRALWGKTLLPPAPAGGRKGEPDA